MQPRTEAPTPVPPSSPNDAARRSAATDVLSRRVHDLERKLATERSQGAARAKEVEAALMVLRKMLQELHAETKRGREENRRLAGQLEESHGVIDELTASAQDPAPDPRVAEFERALESARGAALAARAALESATEDLEASREETARTRGEMDTVRERVRALESDLAARDADLTRSADRIAELTSALDAAKKAASAPPSSVEIAEDGWPQPKPAKAPDAAPAAPSGAAQPPNPVASDAAPKPPAAPISLLAAREEAEKKLGVVPPDASFPVIPGLRIEKLVTEGTTGSVYEARETETRKPVLVRVLPGVLKLLDGKRLDSVLLARHPGLVSVLAFAVCRQGPYLVTDREDGENAADWVRRVGPLSERTALAVVLEAARALRQAAFHGALHGDLGPESVLVDVSGRVRIRGVGLRAVFAQQGDAPRAPSYASPERLRGTPPTDVRSDLYSLGAILHFLLTAKPPYDGDNDAIQQRQKASAPADARTLRGDITEGGAKLIRRLLTSDPDLRPQTWDQVVVELEKLVPGRVPAELVGNLAARPRSFLMAHPWILGAAIAGVLAGAVIVKLVIARDPTAAERFHEAVVIAEKLNAGGDVEGARSVYRRFISGTGDADVELEAARRFDELGANASK